MSDTVAAEPAAEPVQPVPDVAAELEVAPSEAEAPASVEAAADARPLPEIEYPIGATRQAVLDHFLDSEGDQTIAQIIAGVGNASRNTIETAVRREYEAGRLLRGAPGVYRLASPKPPEPSKPAPPPQPESGRSDGMTNQQWFDALESWLVDSSSWDVEALGPPLDQPGHKIPWDISMRFSERLRKRLERRKDAEAAAARRAAADAELRDQLIAACYGNFTPGPGLDDVSPIRAILEDVPIDHVLIGLRQKVDRRCDPMSAPIASWREVRFLPPAARGL